MAANTSKTLRYAGDVSIEKILITTTRGFYQDVTNQVISINLFEDIFSPFMSGNLVLRESLDLVNLFPFIGEEFLDLEITTPTIPHATVKARFHIYKLTDRQLLGDRLVAYQLHFIANEAVVDLNKKISKVYGGKISELVGRFVTDQTEGMESEKSFFVQNTRNNLKYTSNYWSPIKNLTYLADNALSESGSPSYVFFENRNGFNFVSLEALYSGQVVQEFRYDRYTRDSVPLGGNALNTDQDYKRIGNLDIPTGFDYIDRIRSGMLASRLVSYDITKKVYTARNYNMFEKFDKQKHLNKFPVSSDASIFRAASLIINYPRAFETFSGFGDSTNARMVQERTSLLKLAEATKISIDVPGRLDYTVGQKVNVVLNKIEPIQKSDTTNLDNMFSGHYLISAINHSINRQSHTCYMELIKDTSIVNFNEKK
jgi:hypothetical protein